MPKILSKSGDSLADAYDVQGSIAGIDELLSKEVQLVHEMGHVLMSERLASEIVIIETAAIAQSASFTAVIDDVVLSVPFFRLLGVTLSVDTAGRIADACVVMTEAPFPAGASQIPIYRFDGTNTDTLRYAISGTVANQLVLRPDPAYSRFPYMMVGDIQQDSGNSISLRGSTTAFGAGDVTITMAVHVIFPLVEGLSSRGIPLPSW